MKKLSRPKSKLQTTLIIGRPIIILALALVTAVSVIQPAHAFPWAIWGLVALGAVVIGAVAGPSIINGLAHAAAFSTTKILLELMGILVTILQPLLIPLITAIVAFGLGDPNFVLYNSITNSIWKISLEIANTAFLLVLLIAAIAIITRINTGMYNLKKFLGGFIMAVALSNLSLIIVKVMVTLGDQLTNVVIKMAGPLQVSLPAVANGPEANSTGAVAAYFISMIGMKLNQGGWSVETLVIPVAQLIILIITAWIIIKFGLILIERMIRLFAAVVMAPLVFAGSLLPNFQKIAAQWWENTIKWILVLPITMAFLIVSLMFFANAGIHTPADMANIQDILLPPYIIDAMKTYSAGGTPATPDKDAMMQFIYAAIGLFTLWSAGMLSNKFDLKSVMGGLVETPQKTIALGQKAIAQGQRVYKMGADTLTGKNALGKLGKNIKEQTLAGKGLGGIKIGGTTIGELAQKGEAARRTTLTRLGLDTEANKSIGETGVQTKQATKAGTDASAALARLDMATIAATGGQYGSYRELSTLNPALAETLGKTDPRMAKELKTLKGLGKERGFFSKKTRLELEQLNPPSTYEDDLKSGNTEKIQEAYEALKTHARNKNNAGYEKATELLETYKSQIAAGLGMSSEDMVWSPKRKQEEGQGGAVSGSVIDNPHNTSDAARIKYQAKKDTLQTSLRTATGLTDPEIDAMLSSIEDSAAATTKTSALDTASTNAATNITAYGLSAPDRQDKFNAALREKDQKKRRAILTKELGIGDEDTLKTIDALAEDKDTAWDAKSVQGRLAVIQKVGAGNLPAVIDQIKQLQKAAANASSIGANQQQELQQQLDDYQATVSNTLNQAMPGGGPKTISLGSIGNLPNVSTTVSTTADATAAATQILGQLTAQLKSNPTLGGDSNLTALSGGGAQATAVVEALKQLGINMGTTANKVSIDTALKHLRTLTQI